ARTAEGRRGWPVATGVLAVTYLGVWLMFGVVCHAIYAAVSMPWPNQAVVVGLALVLAGVYSLSPIKRASQARCRELCALHGPLPFTLMRSAAVAGVRYGLTCLGGSGALRGERKLVTGLFADVVRSMELAERVDPEEWHRLLDRLFRILADGVHRYEGTINQYTGDGIMALFGAPIAHEDHAQRACAAA